jgi:hypothetical protein
MSRVAELTRRRHVPQVAALALMSISFAGCSADALRGKSLRKLASFTRGHRFGAFRARRKSSAPAISAGGLGTANNAGASGL